MQAWVAVKDAAAGLAARLKEGLSADKEASGAVRLAGTQNFKAKYEPDFPVVTITAAQPGQTVTVDELEQLGVLAPKKPAPPPLGDEIDEEKACDRFAGAFLAPTSTVLQNLGRNRRGVEWQELYALKHEFGLSMAGWLQRAKQCGVITEAAHLSLWKLFSARGWRKNEPGEPVSREHPRLFEQLVYRALGEQFVSESKAAELLGIPMMRFHKERQLELVDAAAHQ